MQNSSIRSLLFGGIAFAAMGCNKTIPDTDTGADTDTVSLPTDALGFVTPGVFTEPLVIVPAAAYWDAVPEPSNVVCTFAPLSGGYSGPCVPDASLLAVDPTWADSTTGNFVAFAFDDADSNGAWDADEVLVAMPTYQLVYAAGEPTAEAATTGLTTGWNALDLWLGGATNSFIAVDPTAIPLTRNLEAAPSVTLGGPIGIAHDGSTRLLVLFSNENGDFPVDKGAITEPWSLEMSGAPLADWANEVVPGMDRDEGWVVAYTDANGSGGYDSGETFLGVPKDADGNGIDVAWISPPADPSIAMRMILTLGVERFGWTAWNTSGRRLPADTTALTLSPM